MTDYPPPKLTPVAFELQVKSILDGSGAHVSDYVSRHREVISAADGEYEFDVVCRFMALGVSFTVLSECKAYKKRVERDRVQALLAKLRSVGAQKGILFSTSGFQSGAVKFAETHGIALVHVADGRSTYLAKAQRSSEEIPWEEVPDYIPEIACWLVGEASESVISGDGNAGALLAALTA